jgi:hypothetical protein
MERWKPVSGYKGRYAVSNTGLVKSLKHGKILKCTVGRKGYLQVCLYTGSAKLGKTFNIASLVMLIFKGPRPVGLDIDHRNRVKTDNRLKNLRYVTKEVNCTNKDVHYNSSSEGVKGVTFQQHYQKWMAQVLTGGKYKNLGRFSTLREAKAKIDKFKNGQT